MGVLEDELKRREFGAGGFDTSMFTGGALEAFNTLAGGAKSGQQAMALTRALSPEPQKFDPAIAALKYFTAMTREASKPGATLIGSAAQAVTDPAEYLMQVNQYNRKLKASEPQTAISLATALKPPTSAGGLTTKSYTLQKTVDGVGNKGQTVTLTNQAAAKIINADPSALVEYSKTTAGKPTKPYPVKIIDEAAFALSFPGVDLPDNKTIDLTNTQVALLPAGSFSLVDTSSTSVGTPKQYSVSEDDLAALNTALGTSLKRDLQGNVTLTPEQFVAGQNFLGGATPKPAQGSAFERNFAIVNELGTKIAAFALDPTLPAPTPLELNEYSAKYQKLVVGGEYTEIVDGKEVTRSRAGIDLDQTTNLPVPEGLDLNKIIEERSQKFDQNQTTAATFGSRMLLNEGILRNVLAEGYELTVADVAQIRTMSTLGLGNIGVGTQAQQFHVAAQNWVAAQLRNESGAAIAASEYADALEQYFPKVGDSLETRKQKQALREEATKGMINSAQDAFGVVYPNALQYLKYTSDDVEYDILNPQGYANELLTKTELGQTLFFKDSLGTMLTPALRRMLANPNAENLFTEEMIDMIVEELAKPEREGQ